ncbi:MAG: carbon storage regulator [Planctomycetes bacterium]|nr:carbon storage regulator [Planctomycetota bacterium]
MLVLSRKQGESLVIGESIRIVVTRIDGNRVSLGIEAPSETRILRAELAVREPARGESRSAMPVVPAAAPPARLCDFVLR